MATKVKPSRINITGAAQVGQTPVYVNEDCFQWGDIPTDNCQLANGCGYQFTSCMVCDFVSPNNTTYPTTEAVCCYVGQKVAGAYKYKGTVADYEDLPTTGLSEGDVYNITNAHTTAPEFPAGANVAWTGSSWDVLGGVFDLSCKQDVLTAGPNITLSGATISGDFNYAEPTTAAATATKCVCIPEITQLCVGQRIVVKPTITATNCATNLQLNNFTAYPVRYNNAALTSTTDGYVWGANQLTEFVFDGSYWHVVSKSYDANTTYTMNYSVDAGKYKAGSGNYAISRYSLVMQKQDMTWEKIVATNQNYSTGTSHNVNTNGFILNQLRYYNTTTNLANGAMAAANVFYSKAASIDLRYSTNCGGVTNWGEGDYMYLVGTMGNDGLFYLDTTTRWTNKLPTTKDGKLYIRIGLCLAAGGYTCTLFDDRPIFYYDNGIKEYKVADNKQDTLVSGTNIKTINGCDVLGCGDLCIAGGVTSVNGQTGAVCLTIPTDNCELANGCGYTTCTGTVSSCSDIISELGYTPYNSTNPCGYTTCTGTVTTTDLQCYVQCCDMSGYQLTCNMVCTLSGADDSHYPTAKTVADALSCAGAGDMLKSVYDPCGCNADAFDYCNFRNTPTIPTDNCQLANGCGYTTCTGTLQACDIANLAQCCDIPTDNCQLANGCGYTTCTGTLSSCADIVSALGYTPYSNANPCGYTTCTGTVSTCADVISALGYTPYNVSNPCGYINNFAGVISALGYTPYNNTNPCGYTSCTGTLSTCSDITTALGYTPYSNSNPCGYTTCTGTLTSADLACYACCCDIPTDNCQLSNGCGYTTCTGTLVPSDIACINGCCLTNGGDICIQGGSGIQNDTTGTTDVIDAIWSGTQVEFNNITHDPDVYYIVKDGQGGGSSIMADILVVGAGGGGSGVCNACKAGYGGGGGEVIECKREILNASSYNISIGQGGTGSCICTTDGGDGGDTTISAGGNIVYCARGGHGAIRVEAAYGNSVIAYMKGFERCYPGQNWKYGASGNLMYGGTLGCSTSAARGGGGGGAGGYGEAYLSTTGVLLVGGTGGPGVISDLSGDRKGYGGGGGGGSGCCPGFGGYGGGGIGNGNATLRNGEANTGGGGGGSGYCGCGGDGGSGVAIIRYLQDGSCGINCATGGTVYCCNGYVIHCFTSDGTFCIVC